MVATVWVDDGADGKGQEEHADDDPGVAAAVGPGETRRKRHVDCSGGKTVADAQRQQRRNDEPDTQRRGHRLLTDEFRIDRRARAERTRIEGTNGKDKGRDSTKVMPATLMRCMR